MKGDPTLSLSAVRRPLLFALLIAAVALPRRHLRLRGFLHVLRERGADVELRVYPGDVHEVNDDEIAATARLLDTVRRAL